MIQAFDKFLAFYLFSKTCRKDLARIKANLIKNHIHFLEFRHQNYTTLTVNKEDWSGAYDIIADTSIGNLMEKEYHGITVSSDTYCGFGDSDTQCHVSVGPVFPGKSHRDIPSAEFRIPSVCRITTNQLAFVIGVLSTLTLGVIAYALGTWKISPP